MVLGNHPIMKQLVCSFRFPRSKRSGQYFGSDFIHREMARWRIWRNHSFSPGRGGLSSKEARIESIRHCQIVEGFANGSGSSRFHQRSIGKASRHGFLAEVKHKDRRKLRFSKVLIFAPSRRAIPPSARHRQRRRRCAVQTIQ